MKQLLLKIIQFPFWLLGFEFDTEEKRLEMRREGDFFICFGFKPNLLQDEQYQKEVITSIMLLAKDAKKYAEIKTRTPAEEQRTHKYREALEEYRKAVLAARHFHKSFRDIPLHWTLFPAFAQSWFGTNSRNPTPTTVVTT
jgi:hypothetical protein